MKKIMKLYTTAVCIIFAVLSLAWVLLPPFGLCITYKMPVMAIFLLVTVVVATILSAVLRGLGDSAGMSAVILFPLTVFFGNVLTFDTNNSSGWWIPLVSATISAVSFVLGKGKFSAKALCGVLALLLSMPLFLIATGNIVFGNFGETTVVSSAESDYSHMSAELIRVDSGALGVDFRIEVWNDRSDAELGFAKISSERRRIIVRDYYVEDVQVYFKNENTVVVNGDEYYVG